MMGEAVSSGEERWPAASRRPRPLWLAGVFFLAIGIHARLFAATDLPRATCTSAAVALVPGQSATATVDAVGPNPGISDISFKAFELSVAAHSPVVLNLVPSDSNVRTSLSVGRCDNGLYRELESIAGSAKLRLGFDPPEQAIYRVRVTAQPTAPLSIQLEAQAIGAAARAEPLSLPPGGTVTGDLAGGTKEIVSGVSYVLYGITLARSERVILKLQTGDAGTTIDVGRQSGDALTDFFVKDLGGGYKRQFILPDGSVGFLAGEAGLYLIRVRAGSASGGGPFTLTTTRLKPAEFSGKAETLNLGRPVSSQITSSDPTMVYQVGTDFLHLEPFATFRPYKLYKLKVSAGQIINISLDSEKFDTLLQVGYLSPLAKGFYPIVQNDDIKPGQNRNSRVGLKFTWDGEIYIRATTTQEGGAGAFKLSAVRCTTTDDRDYKCDDSEIMNDANQ